MRSATTSISSSPPIDMSKAAMKSHLVSHGLSESKKSEEKYRGLLEAAPDAMVVVNQTGEIVLLNVRAEKQFGYRRDELLGQKVKNIIPEGFAERLIADALRSAEDALAQQIGTGIELIGRRKNGSDFPIEIMLSPLESAEGILDKDADEFIAFAVDGASRMQRLIQDLLAYSRIGTKGRDLIGTSGEDGLQQALVNLRGAIEESGALVTHDPLPAVLADESQLIQLFQNLVGNAIKYQGTGIPRVHISAAADGNKKWMF